MPLTMLLPPFRRVSRMPGDRNALAPSQTLRLQTGQDIDLRYVNISWRGCSSGGDEQAQDDQLPAHQLLLGSRALALEICAGADFTLEYTALYSRGAFPGQDLHRCSPSVPLFAGRLCWGLCQRLVSAWIQDVALPSRQLKVL